MSKASNAAKYRWNSKQYTQIKVCIKQNVAASFKSACAAAGTSMAGELSAFMEEYSEAAQLPLKMHTKVKTLGDRRKAMHAVITLLADIQAAEEAYLDSFLESLYNTERYSITEERVEKLSEVIDAAADIYDY